MMFFHLLPSKETEIYISSLRLKNIASTHDHGDKNRPEGPTCNGCGEPAFTPDLEEMTGKD